MNLSKYTAKKIIKKEIESDHLGETRTLRLALPPGYNERVSYPIIYALDGQDAFMYGRLATIVNYLILEKGMEPAIVVGIDVNKSKRTEEYSLLGERHPFFLKFVTEEVLPSLEDEWEVRKTGVSRLLIGDSLAGAAALSLAINHPHLFQHVLSLSGAFFEDSLELIRREDTLEWLHIWMLIGTEETEVKTDRGKFNFLKINRLFREEARHLKAKIRYIEKEGTHRWGFWQQELPNGLLHFLGLR